MGDKFQALIVMFQMIELLKKKEKLTKVSLMSSLPECKYFCVLCFNLLEF